MNYNYPSPEMKHLLFAASLLFAFHTYHLISAESPSMIDDAGLSLHGDALTLISNDKQPSESPNFRVVKGEDSNKTNHILSEFKVKHVKPSDNSRNLKKKKRGRTGLSQKYGTCNQNIIRAFGLTGVDSRFRVFEATSFERHFCVRNTYTCCNEKAYLKSRTLFVKNLKNLEHQLEPIQELMALFRGKAIRGLISQLKTNRDCHYPISQSGISQSAEDFFSDDNVRESIRFIGKQAVQFEIYIRNVRSFYSNMLCAICNPLESNNFKVIDKILTIDVNMDTLEKRIDNLEFEIAFNKIFASFIYPLAKVAKCHMGLETDPKYLLQGINISETLVMEEKIKRCLDHFSSENTYCQSLMYFKIYKHNSHYDISLQVMQSLGALYHAVSGKVIDEYYNQVKSSNWENSQDFYHEFFDKSSRRFRRIRAHQTKFRLKDNGLNVYTNLMTHHFYKLKNSSSLMSIITAILLLLAWHLF